jgi:hypothetical protein
MQVSKVLALIGNYPDESRGKLEEKNVLTFSATVCWK